MKILFDIISTQGSMNGGAEYVCKVFHELIEQLSSDIDIECLYDSSKEFMYKYTSPENIKKLKLKMVDIKKRSLAEIIMQDKIDVFFIGIAQRFFNYNLSEISCRCVCVVHDFYHYEIRGLKEYLFRNDSLKLYRQKYRVLKEDIFQKKNLAKFCSFLRDYPNLTIICVSQFTRASLLYKVVESDSKIVTLYSPLKDSNIVQCIQNKALSDIINSKRPYFLVVSAGRDLKNAGIVLRTYKRYIELFNPGVDLLTIGYSKKEFSNHLVLPFLSTSDLEYAYKNCHALIYPSLWEGFGYPPLEVMKYGKPVLCSNVCSMKEILGDAPLYFSPFYDSDLFAAYSVFFNSNYMMLSERSYECYKKVSEKQFNDLKRLVSIIIGRE